MKTIAFLLIVVSFAAPPATSRAQEAPVAAPLPAEPSEADMAAALAADQKEAAAAAPVAEPVAAPTGGMNFPGLLNPEMSVIGVMSGALRRDANIDPFVASGDDAPVDKLSVQELEISFAGAVDPYFNMRMYLTIPGLKEVEVEEAFMVSTSLPYNLQLKAGTFRSAFGRNNEQHLHVQDFARRPWTTGLLGEDGLRGPGAQLSVLLPTPWYLAAWTEFLSFEDRKATATAGLDSFFDLSNTWSLLLGLSGATIKRAGDPAAPAARTELLGGDMYLKWRPTNELSTYAWSALTVEYIAARDRDGKVWMGTAYSQLITQVARRWRVAVRADFKGLPEGGGGKAMGLAGSLAFLPTEFSRVRFGYQRENDLHSTSVNNDTVFLQLEGSIGAHGAHPF